MTAPPAANTPLDAGHVALELLNRTLATQIGLLLELQAPRTRMAATDIINILCEHVCKLVSLVEPAPARAHLLTEIRRNLPGIVDRHVTARQTTPGGLFVPPPGQRTMQ